MSWIRRKLIRRPGGDSTRLLLLRSTRFRQLLRNYGSFLALQADGDEKQAGDYILDKQYVISLAEKAQDLAEAALLDLNLMTQHRFLSAYAALERSREETRRILLGPPQPSSGPVPYAPRHDPPAREARPAEPSEVVPQDEPTTPERSPAPRSKAVDLAGALAHAQVLYRGQGLVACRGIAAGAVHNLEIDPDPAGVPANAVLVAAELDDTAAIRGLLPGASAVLTERGRTTDRAASLARETRRPMIVGLPGVATRLQSGTQVTVDADENSIYLGRVQELLDYYDAEHVDTTEEPEYRLLRAVRRGVFTLGARDVDGRVDFGACRTAHDLVYLAQLQGGDELARVAAAEVERLRLGIELPLSSGMSGRLVDLGDAVDPAPPDGSVPSRGSLRSRPLRAFLEGFDGETASESHAAGSADKAKALSGPARSSPRGAVILAKEEHACMILRCRGGPDVIDAVLTGSRAANYIYCRFAPSGEDGGANARGAFAREFLSRIGLAVSRSTGPVVGWEGGRSARETEADLRRLGRMAGWLARRDDAGWTAGAPAGIMEELLR